MPDYLSSTVIPPSIPEDDASAAKEDGRPSELTYGDLLPHVEERRLSAPGRARDPAKVASNTRRALAAFMEANELAETSPVGAELLGAGLEEALSKLSTLKAARATRRRWRSEVKARIRPWAIEAARKLEEDWAGQTFAERLDHLMRQTGETARGLARALKAAGQPVRREVIRDWRKGLRTPHPQSQKSRIVAIAERFGVPPSDLLDALPIRGWQSQSYSALANFDPAVRRRIAPHVPDDFDSRAPAEQDEIVRWVRENCLSAPMPVLNGKAVDRSTYALCRPGASKRLRPAPEHLVAEIDGLLRFKTSDFTPIGFQRWRTWNTATASSHENHLMEFFGTCRDLGVPDDMLSLSLTFAPMLIDAFIQWRLERRGGYTTAIYKPLDILAGLLTDKVGFVRQQPGFGQPLSRLPGLVRESDLHAVAADWDAACETARTHIRTRLREVADKVKDTKGRDPFLAIASVLDSPRPAATYYRIVREIRHRMPDDTYPVRQAEALRALILFRIGLATGFRQRNLREMRVNTNPDAPTPIQALREARAGELHWTGSSWRIRMPREAFKKPESSALRGPERDFVLPNRDGLYAEIEAYLEARKVLLGEADDPGLLFVKSIKGTRAKIPAYDGSDLYNMFRAAVVTYGIYNPWRGEGAIEGLRPHGPHQGFRDVPATHLVKTNPGAGVGMAASFLIDTEATIRDHYARFIPADEHAAIAAIIADDIEREGA